MDQNAVKSCKPLAWPAGKPAGQIVVGDVVHARLRPAAHKLSYRVFSLLLDVDRITEVARDNALFSYNGRNLVSLYDIDFGNRDQTPVNVRARAVLDQVGLGDCAAQIILLAYPRVLGGVFNPLSVYFCHRADGVLGALIYEVTNTFGERTSYALAVEGSDLGGARGLTIGQSAAKSMSVSPFTPGRGRYDFRVSQAADTLTVGVAFRDCEGPMIRTHFHGRQVPLTSQELLRQFCRTPFLTQRVVGAIHLEALRLWWKGVPVIRRHRSPDFSVAAPRTAREHLRGTHHA